MKRIINGCEVDWASERVFAWLQDYPTYGYLFEVCADRKQIVKCVHISSTDEESDNTYKDARRFERDARQAVEEFLRQERDGPKSDSFKVQTSEGVADADPVISTENVSVVT
jgi:hypothetical protein